jgi:hypothetical protein
MIISFHRCFVDKPLHAFQRDQRGFLERNCKCRACKQLYGARRRSRLRGEGSSDQAEEGGEEEEEEEGDEDGDEEEQEGSLVLSAKEASRRNAVRRSSGHAPTSYWCTG